MSSRQAIRTKTCVVGICERAGRAGGKGDSRVAATVNYTAPVRGVTGGRAALIVAVFDVAKYSQTISFTHAIHSGSTPYEITLICRFRCARFRLRWDI